MISAITGRRVLPRWTWSANEAPTPAVYPKISTEPEPPHSPDSGPEPLTSISTPTAILTPPPPPAVDHSATQRLIEKARRWRKVSYGWKTTGDYNADYVCVAQKMKHLTGQMAETASFMFDNQPGSVLMHRLLTRRMQDPLLSTSEAAAAKVVDLNHQQLLAMGHILSGQIAYRQGRLVENHYNKRACFLYAGALVLTVGTVVVSPALPSAISFNVCALSGVAIVGCAVLGFNNDLKADEIRWHGNMQLESHLRSMSKSTVASGYDDDVVGLLSPKAPYTGKDTEEAITRVLSTLSRHDAVSQSVYAQAVADVMGEHYEEIRANPEVFRSLYLHTYSGLTKESHHWRDTSSNCTSRRIRLTWLMDDGSRTN